MNRNTTFGFDREPVQHSKCVFCGTEINVGDEYIEHAGNDFCEKECLMTCMIQEGNAERKVAGDDTVRIV